MSTLWLSSSTIFVITIGFAGLLGELSYRLRKNLSFSILGLSILVFGMVVLPPLSLPGIMSWLLWASGFFVFLLYSLRPQALPQSWVTRRFAMRYIALSMVLCAVWNLLTSAGFPALLLATFAATTGLMAWQDSE
ncbi:hypothetical protein KQH54_00990 [bacterium]|nr:hypothetical protein [bacterium]